MGLFDQQESQHLEKAKPLAARMRPQSLEEFVGQQHFLGEGKLLRRILAADRIGSLIFYGSPGTGKTSLAELIARQSHRRFEALNAASAGIKEVRAALDRARDELASGGKQTILFIDELHHFSKVQQDVLLPDVESGVVALIGATTSNPFFSLVSALISRSQIFEFQALTADEIRTLMHRALQDEKRGLARYNIEVEAEALDFLIEVCDGDARRSLNALEIGVLSIHGQDRPFDLEVAQESIQKKAIQYDQDGDAHYDSASALIKSMRGSDPDAALYWLARMIEAGEDPRFLARRIVIAAAEDVGNADPMALLVANAAFAAVEKIGMPEGRILLSQAVTYIATAPKSNASYVAIDEALSDVRNKALLPVPVHLKDSHYRGASQLGHGEGYQYAHASEEGWVDQDYLGVEREYYRPVERGFEATIRKRLEVFKERREKKSGTDDNNRS
ncbi:replication-associated recombination protein A [Gimesia panareensis]|uniref:Replication-associated recombination protein A n=1 Tax=Gimesia panareensis TaxID=2527978 RepID=A0A517QCL7_9PLAN|nr:replication-associated recombination protein A [Gimesia panareensis]QDT29370.1 Replication-associated recombination protein A [Gimesia panareensis]QDU52411.1 Replication-associated recombination protein A [Gimesia panareensis]